MTVRVPQTANANQLLTQQRRSRTLDAVVHAINAAIVPNLPFDPLRPLRASYWMSSVVPEMSEDQLKSGPPY